MASLCHLQLYHFIVLLTLMPEVNPSEKLPFFVYGTLLPGQPNHDLWSEQIVEAKPAFFPNGRLYDMGPYPMLLEGDGYPVKGLLASIRDDDYANILRRLDLLEGIDPQRPSEGDYRRAKRYIQLEQEQSMLSWVYLGRPSAIRTATLIESGEWVAYTVAKRREIFSWWSNHRFGKST